MKKFLAYLVLAVAMTGCAPDREIVDVIKGDPGNPGANGTSCSASETEGGILLTCGETSFLIANGSNGVDGTSCSVQSVEGGAEITCGETTVFVANGTNGQDGSDSNGTSSYETSVSSTCTALNGLDGYYAKKSGNGANASAKIYTDSTCSDTVLTSLSSTDEIEVLNATTILLYQSSDDKVLVLKAGE